MIRKISETLSPHFEEYLDTYILDTKGKKIMKHGGIYVYIPLTDRDYITLTIPLRTVPVPTEEVLEVDVTPFSWQEKVYYFLLFFSYFALFIVESRSSGKKNKITCFLPFSLHISDRVSRSFPLFSRRLLSVCLLSVPFLTLSLFVPNL